MYLQEVGEVMYWIDLALDRDRWRAVVNLVMMLHDCKSCNIPLPGHIAFCPAPEPRQPATKHCTPKAVITHIYSRALDDWHRTARKVLSIL